MRELTPWCHIARMYKTDKGGRHLHAGDICHEYTPVYWDLLHARADSTRHVLEIGINSGASLRLWNDIFPYANIVGVDIDLNCVTEANKIGPRVHAFCVNAVDPTLQNVIGASSMFDLIVDDGSHQIGEQLATLRLLAPFLLYDGLYIVEDVQGIDKWPEVPAGMKLTEYHTPRYVGQSGTDWLAVLQWQTSS